jgi:hypothetical protein
MLTLGLGLAGLPACTSSPKVDSYVAVVSLIDYPQGRRWELRSESHTPPVELYSDSRRNADIKITGDEVVAALVAYMEREGFGAHARDGRAPGNPPGGAQRAFEIEVAGRTRHFVHLPEAPRETRLAFVQLTRRFLELYNEVQSFQTVEDSSSRSPLGPSLGNESR